MGITYLDIENWERREHFKFFMSFEEPFHGVCIDLDCSKAYQNTKEMNRSFYLYYLHCTMKAINEIEHLKYRVTEDDRIKICRQVNISATVNRANDTFGFSYIEYHPDFNFFALNAQKEIERVRQSDTLFPLRDDDEVIHCSTLPWTQFTSLSHARKFSRRDSCPKITFGKMTEKKGVRIMPLSIHVHHALVDGYHVGVFIERLQELLDQ